MNVHATRRASRQAGFTLIELVVVGVIAAILLTVAIGGFGGMFARKRMEGVAAEIATQLQQARSEAVSRNALVRLTFGTDCFVVHTQPLVASTASCNGTAVPTSSAGVVQIASVGRAAGDVTVTRQPVATPVNYYEFNPLNGVMTTDGGVNHGVVIGSTAGAWQLRIRVGPTGRVELCTTTNLAGYAAC